jgi:hypothetical protein
MRLEVRVGISIDLRNRFGVSLRVRMNVRVGM